MFPYKVVHRGHCQSFWLQMDQGLGTAIRVLFETLAEYGIDLGHGQELAESEIIQKALAFLNQRPLKLVILDNLEDNTLPRELILREPMPSGKYPIL